MKTLLRIKFGIFVLVIAIAIPVVPISFGLVTQFITYFQQGANPASIFRGNKLVLPATDQARWLTSQPLEGASASPAQLEELLAAYWQAWQALSRAYQTNDKSDLLTYWAGDAIGQVERGLDGIQKGGQFHFTDRNHQLQLLFFSDDGTSALVQDSNFQVQYTLSSAGRRVEFSMDTSALVFITLDNGFWRIRQITIHYH